MPEIQADPKHVAYCGLYCGACRRYLDDRCPGCHGNSGAKWCKVRSCCLDNGYGSCAECVRFPDPLHCKHFNNLAAKLFGLLFRSDRAACIVQIRKLGMHGHAEEMARRGQHTIPRRGWERSG